MRQLFPRFFWPPILLRVSSVGYPSHCSNGRGQFLTQNRRYQIPPLFQLVLMSLVHDFMLYDHPSEFRQKPMDQSRFWGQKRMAAAIPRMAAAIRIWWNHARNHHVCWCSMSSFHCITITVEFRWDSQRKEHYQREFQISIQQWPRPFSNGRGHSWLIEFCCICSNLLVSSSQ